MTGNLHVRLFQGYVVAVVRGALDLTNTADAMFSLTALAARHQVVIVELSALEFIDCGALSALLRVRRLARRSGGDVLLAAPAANVLRLLSLTSVDAVFDVHASTDAAIASMTRSGVAGACWSAEQHRCVTSEPPAHATSPA